MTPLFGILQLILSSIDLREERKIRKHHSNLLLLLFFFVVLCFFSFFLFKISLTSASGKMGVDVVFPLFPPLSTAKTP